MNEIMHYFTSSDIGLDDIQTLAEQANLTFERHIDNEDKEYPFDQFLFKYEIESSNQRKWIIISSWEISDVNDLFDPDEKPWALNPKSAFSISYYVDRLPQLVNILDRIMEKYQGGIVYTGHLESGILNQSTVKQLLSVRFYPNLRYFFSGYFHQDWKLLPFGDIDPNNVTYQAIVKEYAKSEIPTLVTATIAELEHLLEQDLDEEKLRNVTFRCLGGYVHAPRLVMTYNEWLKSVLQILKSLI